MNKHEFLQLAAFSTNRKSNFDTVKAKVQFRETFGISAHLCAIVWAYFLLHHCADVKVAMEPIHFLWTLLFLWQYMTSVFMESLIGKSQKTIFKYVWPMVKVLAAMLPELVSCLLVVVVVIFSVRRCRRAFSLQLLNLSVCLLLVLILHRLS